MELNKKEIMQEQWIKWEPIHNLAQKYDIDSVSETTDCLNIVLSEEKNSEKKVQIIFESSVICYRKTDETFALQKISELNAKYGKEFYARWTFFKVYDSEYLQWFGQQSYNLSEAYELQHFSIVTPDLIFDIVTPQEPKVIEINTINEE